MVLFPVTVMPISNDLPCIRRIMFHSPITHFSRKPDVSDIVCRQSSFSSKLPRFCLNTMIPMTVTRPNDTTCRLLNYRGLPIVRRMGKVWTRVLDCRGYSPEEIDVTIEGNKIHVHVRHEQTEGEDTECYEMNRAVNIPDDVDPKNITCHLMPSGKLVLQEKLIPPSMTNLDLEETKNEDNNVESSAEKYLGQGRETDESDYENEIPKSHSCPDSCHKSEESRRSANCSRDIQAARNSGLRIVGENGETNLQAEVSIRGFQPSEISIKYRGKRLTVQARREEEHEGYRSYRELTRSFTLPEGVNPEELTARYIEGDHLSITVPFNASKSTPADSDVERILSLRTDSAEDGDDHIPARKADEVSRVEAEIQEGDLQKDPA